MNKGSQLPDALAHLFLICKSPSLNDLIDHLDHYARLVGIDHICLGLDYYKGSEPFTRNPDP
jgi:microsomal dipeptidase-like Zn-dependent dipeptidase